MLLNAKIIDILNLTNNKTKKKFSTSNLSKIYGLHEQFLNKMLLKYNQKAIKDFYL